MDFTSRLQSGHCGLVLVHRWMQGKQNWWQHGMAYAALSQLSRHTGQRVSNSASMLPPVAVGQGEREMATRSPALALQQQVSRWKRTRGVSHTPAWDGSLRVSPPPPVPVPPTYASARASLGCPVCLLKQGRGKEQMALRRPLGAARTAPRARSSTKARPFRTPVLAHTLGRRPGTNWWAEPLHPQ